MPLFTQELLLAVPAQHRLAEKSRVTVTVRDLAAERFVVLHEAHCQSGQTAGFCTHHALAPVATAWTHPLGTVLELVRLGHGVSLVPAMAAAADRDPGRVHRPLSGGKPTRTPAVVRSRMRFRSPLAAAFPGELRAANGRSADSLHP